MFLFHWLFSFVSGLLGFVTGVGEVISDHRFALVALVIVGIICVLLWFLHSAALPFVKPFGVVAIAFLCVDIGYSMKAHEDDKASLEADISARDDLIAIKDADVEKASKRATFDKATGDALSDAVAERDQTIAKLIAERNRRNVKVDPSCSDAIDRSMSRGLRQLRGTPGH